MAEDAGAPYPQRCGESTMRLPETPRIQIPPLPLNGEGKPTITIEWRSKPRCDFLRSVDFTNIIHQNAALEWAYESRHNPQAILPFLFLGPINAAKDERWLSNQKITMVLGTSHAKSRKVEEATQKLGIKYNTLHTPSNQALARNFSHATDLIDRHMQELFVRSQHQTLGNVLVFCETGNDRSASVVVAYLMETCLFNEQASHGRDLRPLVGAIQLCQAQRFCVNFDDTAKHLLCGYLDKLEAEWDVEMSGGQTSHRKRSLERDDNQMDVDGSNGDEDRFEGRSYVAPFVDAALPLPPDHAGLDARMQQVIDMNS